MQAINRADSNLRFSKQLAMILISAVATLFLVISVTAFWISREQNTLSETGTTRMISGGISALEDSLQMITLDYSLWTPAYNSIRAGDAPWIYENIGSGAASEAAAVDLIIIVEPGEAVQYGWVGGMGADPSTDLLPADTIAAMLRLLDDIAIESMEAPTQFARINGQTWLLAITRVLPFSDGLPVGLIDKDLPRHLFGTRIDDTLMSEMGAQFLVDDLMIAQDPVPGMSSLPLGDSSGFGGYAVWTPIRPGNVILGKIALPMVLTLGLIALIAVIASRHVVRSARRLERAVDAAEAADRAKSEFLANVSHELRTPMNGILGMGQVMQTLDLEPKPAKMVGALMTSARSLMTLIVDLLDIARIDSGSRPLEEAPFDPVAALAEVRDLLVLEADKKSLEFNVELPDQGPNYILGDKGCYQQILTNLIGNAIKFTDQGAVTVRIGSTIDLDQMHLDLSVTDTGPGIHPKDHTRIFERFAQADSTSTRRAGGTGLGLSITKSLVELMGGRLNLASEVGKGAVFSVDLSFEIVANPHASLAAE